MVSCSAAYCSNVPKKGYRFFRFPSNAERRAKWVKRCNKEDWTPKTGSRLCEVHFEEDQFEQHREDNLRKLKPNAIPTIFKGPTLTKKGNSKNNIEDNYVFQPDIIINGNKKFSKLERCCFCFKETYPSEGILLVVNGEITQFGLTVKVLMLGSAELSTDYCCRECSAEVLLSFEKMVALNVSAYLTSRKILTNQDIEEILEKGCEKCGELIENLGDYTDHFRNHLLEYTYENNDNDIQPEPIKEVLEEVKVTVIKKDENGDVLEFLKVEDDRLRNDHCYAKKSKEKHGSLVCHICGSCLKNKKSYSKHLWLHKKNPNLNLFTLGNDRKLHKKRHINVDKMEKSLLNCEKCESTFTHRSLLFYHYFLAHDNYRPKKLCTRRRPWHCSLCEKKFASFRILRKHASEDHRGRDVVPFRCEICQRGYCSLKSLRSHIAFKHLHMKKQIHLCDYCPRKYVRQENLLSHIAKIHGNEQIKNSAAMEEVIATNNSDMQYSGLQFEITDDAKDWLVVDEGYIH